MSTNTRLVNFTLARSTIMSDTSKTNAYALIIAHKRNNYAIAVLRLLAFPASYAKRIIYEGTFTPACGCMHLFENAFVANHEGLINSLL